MREVEDEKRFLLATLPPTPGQRRAALVVVAVLFAAFLVAAPYASTPLPHFDAFIPSVGAMVFITDLITSLLLYAQFSIYRAPAILALASGYLFTGLIVIPHALTFPGAFSATGLLGAGLQTSAWLYIIWHSGFPLGLLVYALLKDEGPGKYWTQASTRPAIAWSVVIIVTSVCGLALLTTAGDEYMPRIMLDRAQNTPLVRYVLAVDVLTCVLALLLLWIRRYSFLDQWLMVVAGALITELVLGGVMEPTRFSLGWYFGRGYALVTATIVLVVLLAETTRLYARIVRLYGRLSRSNIELQRERDNKLSTLEAMSASIAHEVRQPLAAIVANGSAAVRFLGQSPPNLEEAQSTLKDIVSDANRANQTFDNIRDLLKITGHQQEPVDVNEIALGALRIARRELDDHHITTQVELMPNPRLVMGHRGQLQQVFLNLIRNAVEAMEFIKDDNRMLRVKTQPNDRGFVIVAVEDTGPGIAPEKLDGIFDAFITTKPQGTGLGLAICKMIIERHGGQLSARSNQKTRGALFQFTLPTQSAAASDP